MSLHQQVTAHIGNRPIVIVLLGAISLGLVLPGLGVHSPLPVFLKQTAPQFELVSRLDQELKNLNLQKQQTGLTEDQLAELDQKIEQTNARLAAAIQPPSRGSTRRRIPPPPPLPAELDYSLSGSPLIDVPRLFMARMSDLEPLEVAVRKQRFKQIMLPLILKANEEILRQRETVKLAIEKQDKEVLDSLSDKYRLPSALKDKTEVEAELLQRVAPVPVSIALAQAAIESGWGLSRFTREGNALYGQWVWNDELGIKATQQSDPRASVRRFPDLLSSVRAYMFNLNTHWAYAEFRQTRARHMTSPDDVSVAELANGLSSYAQIGDEYVQKISRLISQNDLNRFNQAQLVPRVF